MNLGLGNTPAGQYVLPKKDPMYGKLAFFDKYSIHWGTKQAEWMSGVMKKAAGMRKKYISILSNRENFIIQEEIQRHYEFIFFAYYDKNNKKALFFLANRKMDHWIEVNIAEILPANLKEKDIKLVYAGGRECSVNYNQFINKGLMPGEVILGEIK